MNVNDTKSIFSRYSPDAALLVGNGIDQHYEFESFPWGAG